ncbi:hypothetical protein EIP91_008697 [Steccherinum ochraceum]|uniref:Cytochrome P450 n=1 Tax=Steccherinum ochraceum TaxID=92696 RepID=A0A4R0RFW9_9APHY|nr:hypothetical protein EIP91_008697 [Steccherinum ochraceum]
MHVIASFAVGFGLLWTVVTWFRKPKYPLPPGPKPLPIIGNVLDMPSVRPWEKYREWCKQYDSDLVHLDLPGNPAVIVGSVAAATDLFEKRSHNYSDRIRYVVAEMMGWDFNIVIMPYTAQWRAHRKLFHQHFQQSAVDRYIPVQTKYARGFLSWTLNAPTEAREHARRMITSIIVSVTYGKEVSGMDDPFVKMAQMGVEGFSVSMIPGVYWVEFLPFLRHIPSWVPGTTSRKLAEKYRSFVVDTRDKPYAEVKKSVDDGTAALSLAATMYSDVRTEHGGTAEEAVADETARNVAGLAYSAAADTTTFSCEALLLAFALYPRVQKKAQAELDRVVGPHRLPDTDDLAQLPYVRAVVMEAQRWLPIVPFGVPHAAMADDTYEGNWIGKGTVMIPNIWAMLKNPEEYPDPDDFIPERFINDKGEFRTDVRDPLTMAFGFGRRICPGKFFAINILNLYAASVLHAFEITPGSDEHGKTRKLSTEMMSGLISKPKDVPTGLKPRSEAVARLIREAAAELEL